jgi:hypothetical protein
MNAVGNPPLTARYNSALSLAELLRQENKLLREQRDHLDEHQRWLLQEKNKLQADVDNLKQTMVQILDAALELLAVPGVQEGVPEHLKAQVVELKGLLENFKKLPAANPPTDPVCPLCGVSHASNRQ